MSATEASRVHCVPFTEANIVISPTDRRSRSQVFGGAAGNPPGLEVREGDPPAAALDSAKQPAEALDANAAAKALLALVPDRAMSPART